MTNRFTLQIASLLMVLCFGTLSAQEKIDLLDIANGALVLSDTGCYSDDWHSLFLIDGGTDKGWCCETGKVNENVIVFELARQYALERFAIDTTGNEEQSYPGLSARKFSLFASTSGSGTDFRLILTGEAGRAERREFSISPAADARRLKLEVHSNYGEENYNEIMELEAYGAPSGPAPVVKPLEGVYDTSYGYMRIVQSGSRVQGCYDSNGGRMTGATDGRVLQFQWREEGGATGTALMVLASDGSTLNGFWYAGGVFQGFWFGTRVTDGRQPECTVEDDSIGKTLDSTGRAVLYGIYFDTDSATLKPESEQTLGEVLAALEERPNLRVEIGGHTDSTGADAHNNALSLARAESVKAWLVEHGIDAGRLTCRGYGSGAPVADNAKPEGRAMNRRVEVVAID